MRINSPIQKPKKKSYKGVITLFTVLLGAIFIFTFITTNNIKVSLDLFSSKGKYPAAAFVNKRLGTKPTNSADTRSTIGIKTSSGLSADIEFDNSDQKVKLMVRDQNDEPMPRVTVIGNVSKVGKVQLAKEFRMPEHSAGDYRSSPLGLADGGWILTVSAYDLFGSNSNKLLFHTEQPIFLKKMIQ